MPKLTEEQKAIIFVRLRDGVDIRGIAEELQISKNTVLAAKKKIAEYGKIIRRPGSGRGKISTPQDDGELITFLRNNPFKNAVQAREETNFPGSATTARRRIRNSEVRSRCAANKIFLTDLNKRNRIEFSREFADRNDMWQNVIFSDEKTFQSCHNGVIRVYRPRNMRYNERYTRKNNKSGRFSVNVWGWISARGKGVCTIIEERLTAAVYCDVIENIMLTSVRPIFGDNFTFQHDNSPIHTARLVQTCLNNNSIRTLPWPSKSPDINPIENIWGAMTKQMYKENFRPRNREELQNQVVQAWHSIPDEYATNLVLSMPRRLQSVLQNNGSMTKY